MTLKRSLENRIRGWLPKEPTLPSKSTQPQVRQENKPILKRKVSTIWLIVFFVLFFFYLFLFNSQFSTLGFILIGITIAIGVPWLVFRMSSHKTLIKIVYLERQATSLGVSVNFLPLTKNLIGQITTYQWTDKKCPFLNLYNQCMIYRIRPGLFRAFPCMPYVVGYCHRIARDQLHRTPRFSPGQIAEGKMYIQNVAELVKRAIWVFHVDKSRWELNKI